jgi:hypothetical protein
MSNTKTKAKTTTKKQANESKAATSEAKNTGQFKRKKALTLPQLKQSTNDTVYIKFLSAIRISDVAPKEGEEPANVANVVDLTTGQEHIFIVPAVLKGVLETDLKGEYEGKCFECTKLPKPNGKRYNQYEIYEIDA